MTEYTLPESFWRHFLENYWEKRPKLLGRLFDSAILSPEALFEAVAGMPSAKTSGDRFWLSTRSRPVTRDDFRFVPLDVYGPKQEDRSLEGFFSRVKEQLGDWPIGINIHHLERSCPELWFRFRAFVSGLNRVTGTLPSGRWDIDMFLGTYEATPLGIHRDNASVFAMGVMGKRTYYTWPEEYFRPGDAALSTLDLEVIEPHLKHAVRMDLVPGDVVYWPSSNWHLVVSDGSPSAVVSISAYFGEKFSAVIANQIRHLLATQLNDKDFQTVYDSPESLSQPPQNLVAAYHGMVQMLREGRLSDGLQQYWLVFRTAEGMHSVASDPDARLAPGDCVAVDADYPIAWASLSNGGCIIAVNGLAFTIDGTSAKVIGELLQQLNSGEPARVSELIERYASGDTQATYINEVLTLLHRCRAFRMVKC